MVDYEDLLNQARQGAPRSVFTPYVAELCDVRNFEDPTKMRLLGNSIANSKPNAEILAQHQEAVDKLLTMDPLGLQILYNGTVGNSEFAQKLLKSPNFTKLTPSPGSKNLLGSIFEALHSTETSIPSDILVDLSSNGFLELIIQDPSLETNQKLVDNFAKIYASAQQCSLAPSNEEDDEEEYEDDVNTLGIRVVGNISSHKTFGIEQAKCVADSPFTWETVALLANLTAELKNVPEVLSSWNIFPNVVDLIKSEDPELDEDVHATEQEAKEEEEPEEEEPQQEEPESEAESEGAVEQYGNDFGADGQEDEEQEEGEEAETPFDIELWGPFLRNISRDPKASQEIAKYSPLYFYKQLIEYKSTKRVGQDFVIALAANVYDAELADFVLAQEPFDAVSVSMASAIYSGLINSSNSEITENEPRIATLVAECITSGLTKDAPESIWVRGTKTLAMISEKHPKIVKKPVLEEKMPNSEYVRSNLGKISG